MRELGTLDASGAPAVVSAGGIIARDASCVSAQRDPAGTSGTFYARRHVFTLDAAATVSVRVDDRSDDLRTYVVLLEGRSADGSGTVVGRGAASGARHPFGPGAAELRHLLVAAGTYTIEATTYDSGATGGYSLRVERWAADSCVRELGTLDASGAPAVVSAGGIIARDASCVSAQRDPAGTSGTFYARRHVFTLDAAATVSVRVDDRSDDLRTYVVLLEGRSADGSGTVVGRGAASGARHPFGPGAAELRHLLVAAGTYTIEATTYDSGATGGYSLRVERWAADSCVRELGTLDASGAPAVVSAGGIIARDASCVSAQRDPAGTSGTFYARRHVFTLDAAATVSVRVDDRSDDLRTYVVLLEGRSADGSGTVVGRGAASGARHPFGPGAAELRHLLVAAGTYTIEATTYDSGATGGYSLRVERWAADSCVRELGTLDASGAPAVVSAGGIIARDASCVSAQRDPAGTSGTFYARRHVFTLDAAATVSVRVDDRSDDLRTYVVLLEGRSADGSGTVVGRGAASGARHPFGPGAAELRHLLVAAGTYTIEATTYDSGATGGYSLRVERWAADSCVRELGTLDASGAPAVVSAGGIIARDASCVSAQRDPAGTSGTFYARRHVFTLDAAATVSVRVDDTSDDLRTYVVLLEGRSADGSGTVVGRGAASGVRHPFGPGAAELRHLLVAAGTYTIEATTYDSGATGGYSLRVERWAADSCVRELGTLDASGAPAVVSAGGIIARDASCVSAQRDPAGTSGTFYARRHVFTLDAAATVSVRVDDTSDDLRTYVVLLEGRSADGSGTVVAQAASGVSRHGTALTADLPHLLLAAGTYTIEATTTSSATTGGYSLRVERWAADSCVRELGTLDASGAPAVVSAGGIIARDASCVSAQRDPAGTSGTFYARRHVFTLDAAATVSVRVDDTSDNLRTYVVLLEGRSADGSGTVVAQAASGVSRHGTALTADLPHLLLAAGTYTIEATTTSSATTGGYSLRVERAPARELVGAVLVGGTAVELIFDAALDETSVPAVDAFSVTVGGVGRTVTAVSVLGRVVTLALASAVLSTQDVTVSYTVPTAVGAARIESSDGAAAVGFTDHPVGVRPEAPDVEVTPGATDLTVAWDAVAGVTAFDIEYRMDDEATWQSVRTGIRESFTIGGLQAPALYCGRVRGVKTAGGQDGTTLYATDWSTPAPGIVGDWTPPSLRVIPDHQALIVTWDHLPVATAFEVESWPLGMIDQRTAARAVRSDDGWFARIGDLDNDVPYGIAVRSVRRAVLATDSSSGVDETLRSTPVTASARPGGFSVGSVEPGFVTSGATATVSVRLVDADGRPFAGARMGAELSAGPTFDADTATVVACDGGCVTDGDGYLTLVYEVASLRGAQRRDNIDQVRVYWDTDSDGRFDAGTDPLATASVHLFRPVNYVALGDSYSAGENGRTGTDGEFAEIPDVSSYLNDKPSDHECRRWSLAFSQVLDLAVYPVMGDVAVSTFACTGAISYNVFRPDDVEQVPGDPHTSDAFTDRPSMSGDVPTKHLGVDASLGEVNANWEPRQVVSLNRVDDVLGVDMVTITIGGNDLRFSEALRTCVLGTCDDDFFGGAAARRSIFGQVGERIRDVLREVKRATADGSIGDREATVFVLGYPYLTPSPSTTGCVGLTAGPALDKGENYYHLVNFALDRILLTADFEKWEIDTDEQAYLRVLADALNFEIRLAAARERVHYVDVAAAFDGHDACGEEAWLNGVVEADGFKAVSDRSFHPNAAGHEAYASVLGAYIERAVRDVRSDPDRLERAHLTAAGLPVNPNTVLASGDGDAAGSSDPPVAARATAETGESSEKAAVTPPERTSLRVQRASTAATCGLFSPGEQVTLVAEGFAPGSAVRLAVFGVSATGTGLSPAAIPATTADADGRVEVSWTVPSAPEAATDAIPRGFVVTATGTRPGGATLVAGTLRPIVAYPGTAPCAVDDSAATTVGRAARVAVLANDTAPTGGSLTAASVRLESVHNADVVVNTTDGSLTYTPDAGFVGTDTFGYWVYDNWGIGVRAEVTVVVSAGCTITGTAGVTDIVGTDGDDVICVPDPDDPTAFHIIDAKGGDDVILGGDGIDWIDGGPGADTIYARRGADRINAGAGVDTIHSGRGFDMIHSRDLADAIHDDPDDDMDGYDLVLVPAAVSAPSAPVLVGDAAYAATGETLLIDVLGNDFDPDSDLDDATLTIIQAPISGAAEVLTTADLSAHISYTASGAAGADMFTYQVCDRRGACSTAVVTVTVGTDHCTITGTADDDTLSGTPGADIICGLAGNDVIYGLGGDDVLIGGPGDDTLYGGDETRIGAGDGDDVLFGGPGDDMLHGGNGTDILWGGAGADTLEGDRRNDVLVGGAGADSLVGGGEDDVLWGGPGDDTLVGHAHNDILHGGLGDDTLSGGSGADTLWGDAGDDDLTGGAGGDVLHGGAGDDIGHGNTQSDTLWGGPGDDTLRGGGGDDEVHGGAGGDSLRGDAGDDTLFGGWGDDTVDGGDGTDYLGGGDGADGCRRGEVTARCES